MFKPVRVRDFCVRGSGARTARPSGILLLLPFFRLYVNLRSYEEQTNCCQREKLTISKRGPNGDS